MTKKIAHRALQKQSRNYRKEVEMNRYRTWFTVQQVGQILGKTQAKVRSLINSGKLKAYINKRRRSYRVYRKDLIKFINSNSGKAPNPDPMNAIQVAGILETTPTQVQLLVCSRNLKGYFHENPELCLIDGIALLIFMENDSENELNLDWMNAIEAASILKTTPAYVQELLRSKKLKGRYHPFPKGCRVDRKDLDRYINEGNPNPNPNPNPDWMNAIEAASILGTSPVKVQRYLMKGDLKGRYHQDPKKCQIRRRDLSIFRDQYLGPSKPAGVPHRQMPIHPY